MNVRGRGSRALVTGAALSALLFFAACQPLSSQLAPPAGSTPPSGGSVGPDPSPTGAATSAPDAGQPTVAPGPPKSSKTRSEAEKAKAKDAKKTKDNKTKDSKISKSKTKKPDPKPKLTPGPALLTRGSTGERVRDLQARLKQIGWFGDSVTGTYGPVTGTSVTGFQARRAIPQTGAVDQRTWDRLAAMTRLPTHNEKYNVAPKASKPSKAGLDRRCLTGRALCISKTSNSLVWVIDGKTQLRVDVRFGSAELPTREGAFQVGWKSRDHVSTIYHTRMPYAMFFSGGQAVHYSPDFAARGYNGASHGCINVRNLAGIQTLFSQVRVGDKVIVYR